jgi:hypothetical protein
MELSNLQAYYDCASWLFESHPLALELFIAVARMIENEYVYREVRFFILFFYFW